VNRKQTLYKVKKEAVAKALADVESVFGTLGQWAAHRYFRLSLGQLEKRRRGEIEWGLDELMILERLADLPPATLYTWTGPTEPIPGGWKEGKEESS